MNGTQLNSVVVVVVVGLHRSVALELPPGTIGADSTGATGNFAPVLTQQLGQMLRFAPVPFMAVL